MKKKQILIIGGGAAGYFAALRAAESNPNCQITIAEAGNKPLQKVSISGGGRCNVTQGCFEIDELLKGYPRGSKELKSAFYRFQAKDTVNWFKQRGVELKREIDGRMFPTSDCSKTIIDCFENQRKKLRIELKLKTKVINVSKNSDGFFEVNLLNKDSKHEAVHFFDSILIATGSASIGYNIAESLGHSIQKCVPSLFTFKVEDKRIKSIPGVSVQEASMALLVGKNSFECEGPILITHWGFSGPAIIKLSAFAAKALHANNYEAQLKINWLPQTKLEKFDNEVASFRKNHPKKSVLKNSLVDIPKRLWETLCTFSNISPETQYCEIKKESLKSLKKEIFEGRYLVKGKGVFKEEFVTCGGVNLKEIDFRTMESKITKRLFFAGEILDIDGITGGYNFQSAWSTGYIAGSAISD